MVEAIGPAIEDTMPSGQPGDYVRNATIDRDHWLVVLAGVLVGWPVDELLFNNDNELI